MPLFVPDVDSGGGGTTLAAVKAYIVGGDSGLSWASGHDANIPFAHTAYDQGTTAAQHDNTTNPDRLTCQQAGVYQVAANVGAQVNNASLGGNVQFYLYHYDSLDEVVEWLAYNWVPLNEETGTQYITVSLCGQAQLAVGDYVVVEMDNRAVQTITSMASAGQWPSLGWTQVS